MTSQPTQPPTDGAGDTDAPSARLTAETVDIGPECFATTTGDVLCWQGRNYVPQDHHAADMRKFGGIIDELEVELDRLRTERDDLATRISARTVIKQTISELEDERTALAAKIAAGDASDGYHTHNELYEYRMLYNAHAARGWLADGHHVVKSWWHSDGEPCFGGGWFIVTAELPSGQVSNHYKAEHWGLFNVPDVDLPPEYDGHTPEEAAARLRATLGFAQDGDSND